MIGGGDGGFSIMEPKKASMVFSTLFSLIRFSLFISLLILFPSSIILPKELLKELIGFIIEPKIN